MRAYTPGMMNDDALLDRRVTRDLAMCAAMAWNSIA